MKNLKFENTHIYFDNCAGMPLSSEVCRAVEQALHLVGNPMSVHSYGQKVRFYLENARKIVGDYFYAPPSNVVFTSSGTEANNQVLKSFLPHEIAVSAIEHNSVIEVFNGAISGSNDKNLALNHTKSKSMHIIPVDKNGIVNLQELRNILENNSHIKLVSIMVVNNVLGTIQPLEEIKVVCKKYNVLFHCDMAQFMYCITREIVEGIDFITISSHKIGAPAGTGAIITNDTGKKQLMPLITGGSAEFGARAGSHNIIGIIAFGAAVENITASAWLNLSNLSNALKEGVSAICDYAIVIPQYIKTVANIVPLRMKNIDSSSQIMHFDLEGFCVGGGSAACSSGKNQQPYVLKAIGLTTNDLIRVSFSPDNTKDEVEKFILSWEKMFKGNNKASHQGSI